MVHTYPKSRLWDPTVKVYVFSFQIWKNAIDKRSLIECASVSQDIEHDWFASLNKIVIIAASSRWPDASLEWHLPAIAQTFLRTE
jgi:hypothetical protein